MSPPASKFAVPEPQRGNCDRAGDATRKGRGRPVLRIAYASEFLGTTHPVHFLLSGQFSRHDPRRVNVICLVSSQALYDEPILGCERTVPSPVNYSLANGTSSGAREATRAHAVASMLKERGNLDVVIGNEAPASS